MSSAKESETVVDPLTERINSKGWRVISNPTRQPTPEANELKTLMPTVRTQQRVPVRWQLEETDPPEAA
jgi:hypothetical protein